MIAPTGGDAIWTRASVASVTLLTHVTDLWLLPPLYLLLSARPYLAWKVLQQREGRSACLLRVRRRHVRLSHSGSRVQGAEILDRSSEVSVALPKPRRLFVPESYDRHWRLARAS
jgi:hypothetical protein